MYLYLFLIIIIYIFFYYLLIYNNNNIIESNDNIKQVLYDKLMEDFNIIFPDRNRNSGGVQFFKHIIDNLNPNKEEFDLYNQF